MVECHGHLLLIDDDERLRDLLNRFLTGKGYVVTVAASAEDAARLLAKMTFDLVVLDVMLPGQNGIDFAREIRTSSDIPILLLTAKGEADDRIMGLEAGADDYLVKPFDPRELLLRIGTILRRTRPMSDTPEIIFGEFVFNPQTGELRRGIELVHLTTGEASLLQVLAQRHGAPISRYELGQRASIEGSDRAVDVQMARLRRKIEQDPRQPAYLLTVRGEGYVLRAGA